MCQYTIDLPDNIHQFLCAYSQRSGISLAEGIERAFALLVVADRAEEKGLVMGIVHAHDDRPLTATGVVRNIFV